MNIPKIKWLWLMLVYIIQVVIKWVVYMVYGLKVGLAAEVHGIVKVVPGAPIEVKWHLNKLNYV